MGMHKSNSKQPRGRTNIHGSQSLAAGGSGLDDQRQIRNAGTNRPNSKGSHMRRGDRRDTQPQK